MEEYDWKFTEMMNHAINTVKNFWRWWRFAQNFSNQLKYSCSFHILWNHFSESLQMQLQIQMIEMKFWWFIYSVRCRNHNGNLSNMGKFSREWSLEPVNLLNSWTEQFWHQLNEAEMKIFAFDNAGIRTRNHELTTEVRNFRNVWEFDKNWLSLKFWEPRGWFHEQQFS